MEWWSIGARPGAIRWETYILHCNIPESDPLDARFANTVLGQGVGNFDVLALPVEGII